MALAESFNLWYLSAPQPIMPFLLLLLVKGLISRWLHVLSWQKNVRLSTQEASKGKQGAFFHPQVWQSNSSLETCKVSRETNWPFDTAAAATNFWS